MALSLAISMSSLSVARRLSVLTPNSRRSSHQGQAIKVLFGRRNHSHSSLGTETVRAVGAVSRDATNSKNSTNSTNIRRSFATITGANTNTNIFTNASNNTSNNNITSKTQSHEIQSRLLKGVHPLHLFRIVQDVDRYKDFLPMCSHSKVFPNTIQNDGRRFAAELVVGFGGPLGISMFQTRYFSEVVVDPMTLEIETTSGESVSAGTSHSSSGGNGGGGGGGGGDGNADDKDNNYGSMFDSLTSRWKLRPVLQSQSQSLIVVGTSVDFQVEMTVSDPVTIAVLNQVLENVAESQVEAFYERCKALPPPSPEELAVAETFYETLGGQGQPLPR